MNMLNFVEFHQDGESLFIRKDIIIVFGISDNIDYNTTITTKDSSEYNVDETIEQVKKALNV